jgi:hypothetical protein
MRLLARPISGGARDPIDASHKAMSPPSVLLEAGEGHRAPGTREGSCLTKGGDVSAVKELLNCGAR